MVLGCPGHIGILALFGPISNNGFCKGSLTISFEQKSFASPLVHPTRTFGSSDSASKVVEASHSHQCPISETQSSLELGASGISATCTLAILDVDLDLPEVCKEYPYANHGAGIFTYMTG